MFVKERFKLVESTLEEIRSMIPDFGYNGFGEFLYFRTYSRNICKNCRQPSIKLNPITGKEYCGSCGRGQVANSNDIFLPNDLETCQEWWPDTIIRAVQGTFSIRKDWYIKNHIPWDESFWQVYARHFAVSMYKMEWLPPGRGLWAMGSDFVYERGSAALQNCGFTIIGETLENDIHWMMDMLMCGVGVGFLPERQDELTVYNPKGTYDYVIPDSREGWCDSTKALITSFREKGSPKPRFIYDEIREEGAPIRGFGGVCSGPAPLIKFHQRIEMLMEQYACEEWYDSVLLKTDLANCTGCCVVAGNVRRSAELCAGTIDEVMDLKQYDKYPYRKDWGYMSNNSVFLETSEDFERLGEIAKRVILNGEPGYINKVNLPFGRIGKSMDGLRLDKAIAFNPCGEQPLEDKELCTLVETIPMRCKTDEAWLRAVEYATVYATTVTLLPTHRPETNSVMYRNRRIGGSIINVAEWSDKIGTHKLIANLRKGYEKVRNVGHWCNSEAGIPDPIRHTTIKPGGTTPNLPGQNSGFNRPNFEFMIRRVRLSRNSPVYQILLDAGVPHEPDVTDPKGTEIFEFPVHKTGFKKVSLWEQASMLCLLQREWSDNAVSNTLNFRPKWNLKYHLWPTVQNFLQADSVLDQYMSLAERIEVFNKKLPSINSFREFKATFEFSENVEVKIYEYDENHEEDDIEPVLSSIAPLTKSVAMLPITPKGVYAQMPEEGITEDEYNDRLLRIKPIDWSKLRGSDGIDERYCEGPQCVVRHG